MRKYEVAFLNPDGDIDDFSRLAPALQPFEDAFSALGRGAIVETENGPMAVEDLLPGDRVMTSSSGLQKLLWRGTISVVPGDQNKRPEMGTLTRITSDALGLSRPAHDLVLGPSARLTYRAPGVERLTGDLAAFLPARDLIDGHSIIELRPASPVQVFQLGFARHETLKVNGVDVETLHPGPAHLLGLSRELQMLLVSLFPHKHGLSSFGSLRHPRIRLRDLDVFAVA